MKIPTTETTQGEGGILDVPGTFHVVINEVLEGQTKKGKAIDGLTVAFEVLDGTEKGKEGKVHTESFFLPTLQDKDTSAAMKLRKITAMAVAGNVLTPEQLGTEAEIPVGEMIGSQMIVKFDHQMELDGEGKYTIPSQYIQVAYSDLFHVDDPAVKAVPKNGEALGLIPKEHRHNEAWFAWKKRVGKQKPAGATQQTAKAGATEADDLF